MKIRSKFVSGKTWCIDTNREDLHPDTISAIRCLRPVPWIKEYSLPGEVVLRDITIDEETMYATIIKK